MAGKQLNFWNLYLKHLEKVKLIFGENEVCTAIFISCHPTQRMSKNAAGYCRVDLEVDQTTGSTSCKRGVRLTNSLTFVLVSFRDARNLPLIMSHAQIVY